MKVSVHYAQSLDGRIATRTGHSQWLSCPASLRFAHKLRATHDAVLVGVGTVLADDPQLTVRLVSGPSPLRIVTDSTLRLPLDARLLGDGAVDTLIATTARASEERIRAVREQGAQVLIANQNLRGQVDLADLLGRLDAMGLASVLLEGGRELITSALDARLVDRLVVCIAPRIIGAGIEAVGDLHIRRMNDALTFEEASFTPLGEDVIFDGQLARVPAGTV